MRSVLLLGGSGKMGSTIALNLSKDFDVTIVDLKPLDSMIQDMIKTEVKYIKIDVEDSERLFYLSQDYDLIINALPRYYYWYILDLAAGARKPIYIVTEGNDYDKINKFGIQNHIPIYTDLGLAPGLTNLLVGNALWNPYYIDVPKSIKVYIGNLTNDKLSYPKLAHGSSLVDQLIRYTRPARYISNHSIQSKDPLSWHEEIIVPGINITLEGSMIDRLGTLVQPGLVQDLCTKELMPSHYTEDVIGFIKNDCFIEKILESHKIIKDIVVIVIDRDEERKVIIYESSGYLTSLQEIVSSFCSTVVRYSCEDNFKGMSRPGINLIEKMDYRYFKDKMQEDKIYI